MHTVTQNGKTLTNAPLADIKNEYGSDTALQSAKAARLREINAACDIALHALAATYPSAEVASFDKQEAEALAIVADATAPAPLLRAIAGSRHIDVVEIAQRVIAKAALFAEASGNIIGSRQALEDAIDTATSVDNLDAITWQY